MITEIVKSIFKRNLNIHHTYVIGIEASIFTIFYSYLKYYHIKKIKIILLSRYNYCYYF